MPFIPNILPEATSAVTYETPLMAVVEESTEDSAEEAGDVLILDTMLEATTQQGKETEPEVVEVPPTERGGGGEAEPKENVIDGKATSS